MVVKANEDGLSIAYVQAGAGVVADSDPAAEFDETRAKAAALFAAMRSASSDLL